MRREIVILAIITPPFPQTEEGWGDNMIIRIIIMKEEVGIT